MWETGAAVISSLIGGVGLLAGWFSWRRSELRREDVLAWSNEVIESLQTLLLVCILRDPPLDKKTSETKLRDVIFQTSILIERGRLFFKNKVVDQYGAEKLPAYRGYRPTILDPIVVAHQVACGWIGADRERKLRMRLIAEECLKKFVSLAQKEVGRGRTASADTSRSGDGFHLEDLINEVDSVRLEKLKATGR